MTGPKAMLSPSASPADIMQLSGDYELIVILVEFTDTKHKTSRDTIHNLIFTKMNKYWREVSYNQFNVIGDTVGWFNIGHDEAYYGKDTDPKTPGSDQKDRELIRDSCRLATNVDFSKYQDIIVVFAGHGQDSDIKNTNLIWPAAYRYGLDVVCGGKRFDTAGWTGELVKDDGLGLGVITHEFGHTLGLPDLYNATLGTDESDNLVGPWSLMAEGSWAGPRGSRASNPIGLDSWSRIKLGWLSSVSVPLTADGFVQPLNQLGDAIGPRALKVQASGDSYYLFEARAKTGVDAYVPSSGVLITRIDESKESGGGIVKVIGCHAKPVSIDRAACNPNEAWSDTSDNIYMKILKKQGTSYTIGFATKTITTTKNMYSAELSMTNLPPGASPNVTIDGAEYGTVSPDMHKLTLTFLGLAASTHKVTLSQCIMTSEGTRSCTNKNAITISKLGTYEIDYVTQSMLRIRTDPSSVSGGDERWITAGQTATLGPYDDTISMTAGTRYVLLGLVVDGTLVADKSLTLVMDRPHIVTVRYVTQYLLEIVTSYGDPKGEGWYDSGDLATCSVTAIHPMSGLFGLLGGKYVFDHWSGDSTSTTPTVYVRMDGPKTIVAQWSADITMAYTLVGAIVTITIVVIALLFVMRRRSRPRVAPPSALAVPTPQLAPW